MNTYPPTTVTFVRGAGSIVWDDSGKQYLDFLSGLAVTSLGHANPVVADALAQQANTLLHVSNLFGTEPGEDVAATLDELLGGGGLVFFCNSGAEANECALKLARKFGGRGRHVVVSAYGSFHGRTLATLHATGQPQKHEAFQPLP
ncbi:MAG: acetylornithine/N-succinyldiaminopimelate aminotransferase, partial [Acidimicrobiaceae bacterium]